MKKGCSNEGVLDIEEVERADKEQLARWYRFLPSGQNAADQKIMKRIAERFEKLAGMTAGLSNQQEDWDVTELQSRATFHFAVLHSPSELALRTGGSDRAETEIQVSALFPVSEQGPARQSKAPHTMLQIPPSPPKFLVYFHLVHSLALSVYL